MRNNNAILYVIIIVLAIGLCGMLIALGVVLTRSVITGTQDHSASPTHPLFTSPLPTEPPLAETPDNETPSPETTVTSLPTGKIVLTCKLTDDGDDEICIMNADGSSYRQLTFNDFENYYPSLSPDGTSVVFSSNMTGIFEIYEMELSTGIPKRLTSNLHETFAPEISPDGTLIVFGALYENTASIWLMNRDGSDPHQIFQDPTQDSADPTWSPDGKRILFAIGKLNEKKLWTITTEGEDLRLISDTFRTRGRSDWSADNTIIAAYGGYAPLWEIYFMSPDGSNLRQMTFSGRNLAPSFSPDSQWMVYTSYGGNNEDLNACEIYIMRVDGSQETRLTYNNYCDWQPRWSR